MPATNGRIREHLRRFNRVWIERPIYFVTTRTFKQRGILASKEAAHVLVDEWQNAHDRHGWGNRPLCHYARSRALPLSSRIGCESAAKLYARLEAVDEQANSPARAALVKRSDEWPWQGEIEFLML